MQKDTVSGTVLPTSPCAEGGNGGRGDRINVALFANKERYIENC